MSDWQPIETAPKDGTSVLLFGPLGVVLGRWCDAQRDTEDFYKRHQLLNFFSHTGWSYDFVDQHQPTHWMPLPEPPK